MSSRYENKTRPTTVNAQNIIDALESEDRRREGDSLLALMREVTGDKPVVWGNGIIGFGTYHYQHAASGCAGDWPRTGFAMRKRNIVVYIMNGFSQYESLLADLGPHRTGSSCLYLTRLSRINLAVLRTLVTRSYRDMLQRYPH